MQILLQANEAGSAQQTVWVKCTAATRSKQIRQLSSDLILGSLEIKYEKNSLGESSKKGVTNVLKHIWAFFFFWSAEFQILTFPPLVWHLSHFFEDFP